MNLSYTQENDTALKTIFKEVTELLCDVHGWTVNSDEYTVTYSKGTHHMYITVDKEYVRVSTPILNSNKNFTTKFMNYFDTNEYILSTMVYFIESNEHYNTSIHEVL